MKNIIVTVLVTLVIAATVSALSIVSYVAVTNDSESPPQPDRVVAVLAKCLMACPNNQRTEWIGERCEAGDHDLGQCAVINSRWQVTVRTASGSTYEIEVPITTGVAVGDTWPK